MRFSANGKATYGDIEKMFDAMVQYLHSEGVDDFCSVNFYLTPLKNGRKAKCCNMAMELSAEVKEERKPKKPSPPKRAPGLRLAVDNTIAATG